MKLFKSIQAVDSKLDSIEEKLATMATKDELYQKFDDMAARLDINDTERGALESQVDRHESWIKTLAHKTSTELTP